MEMYHKIQSIFKRDAKGKFIWGDWATEELAALHDIEWEWTEKVDGTNIRLWRDDEGLHIGGRTERAQIPAHLIDGINRLEGLENLAPGMLLVGEGYGAKIQKGGGNYRPDASFVLFDVKVGDWWLRRADVRDVAMGLGLRAVPVVGHGTIHEAIDFVSRGFTSTWGDFEAEGLVCRPVPELFDRAGRRIICKVKAKDIRAAGRM